jgi:hypothetical protein
MQTNIMQSSTESDAAKEKETQAISHMISDLNEVRMRLDYVVRKLADTQRDEVEDPGGVETVEAFRVQLAGQFDRIREKLVAKIPPPA